MTIRQSKLKAGVLTVDGKAFASQATSVRIVPKSKEDGDSLEVLSGEVTGGDVKTEYQLVISSIQDFDDPAGFQLTSWDLDGQIVDFTWQPNQTSGTWSGEVLVTPVEIGGKVNTRLDVDAEWTIPTKPTRTAPAGG